MNKATTGVRNGVILDLDHVVKAYGPRKALDGVSISINAGEFVALLGPNGAGKTTLFQLLTGLFVPDGGSIPSVLPCLQGESCP